MNIYLFWILFLALWGIVPLMIIKGKKEESPRIRTSPEVKEKKKVGLIRDLLDFISHYKPINFEILIILEIFFKASLI